MAGVKALDRTSKPHIVRGATGTRVNVTWPNVGRLGPQGPVGPPGGSDASFAAFVNDPASQTAINLASKFVEDVRVTTNWDTTTTTGWYYATGLASAPDTGDWLGQVTAVDANTVVQELVPYNSATFKTGTATGSKRRVRTSGTWGAWYSLMDSLTEMDTRYRPAWQAYTPTITSGTVGTGSGSLVGKYIQINKTIHYEIKWVLGTGFAISSNTVLGTPGVRSGFGIYGASMSVRYTDHPAGNLYLGNGIQWSTGVSCYGVGTNGLALGIAPTVPFTWTTLDEVYIAGTYEIF